MMNTAIKNNYNKFFSKKGGYTLLFAVLVSSVVLSVGFSILSISKKEFLLSSSARESTTALYAADSGMECATYWDASPGDELATTTVSPSTIICGNMAEPYTDIQVSYLQDPVGVYVATFSFPVGDGEACAEVTVTKDYATHVLSGMYIQRTKIESKGYNLGWDGANLNFNCKAASPRKVERALRLNY